MRYLLGLLCLLTTSPAYADEAAAPISPVDVSTDPHPALTQRVDSAIRAYLDGEHDRAVAELTAINALPGLTDPAVAERARVFLAEVLFVRGAREAAWDAFRAVLDENPAAQLDPFEHPPDVVAFFETVKSSGPRSQSLTANTGLPPRTRFPRTGFMPFGVYQFQRGQRTTGALLALTQVGTGVASIVLWNQLRDHNQAVEEEELSQLQRRRDVQLSMGGSFYGLWALGVLVAARDWERREGTAIRLQPKPNGAVLSLSF
jgi:hypothetical protein